MNIGQIGRRLNLAHKVNYGGKVMTKREALERCMIQWTKIYHELVRMEAAATDGELFQIPVFSVFKREVLRSMGVSEDDRPINSCYICEYVETNYPTPYNALLACEYCPLKGYAWEQCETDGPYLACENAYDDEWFGDAADCAQEIIDACDRALEDVDNEE